MLAEPMSSAPDCVVCGLHPRAVCSACVSAGLQGKIAFGIDYPLESSMERCFYCRRQEAEWCWQCYSCASGDSYGLTHYTDHDLQNGQDGRYYVVLTSIALSKFQTQIGQVGSSIDPLVRKCRPPNHFNTSEGAAGSRAGRLSVYTSTPDAAVEMHKRLVPMVREVQPSAWPDYATSHFGATLKPGRQRGLYRVASYGLAAGFVAALLAIASLRRGIVNGPVAVGIGIFALLLVLYFVASIQDNKNKRAAATIPMEPDGDQTSEISRKSRT